MAASRTGSRSGSSCVLLSVLARECRWAFRSAKTLTARSRGPHSGPNRRLHGPFSGPNRRLEGPFPLPRGRCGAGGALAGPGPQRILEEEGLAFSASLLFREESPGSVECGPYCGPFRRMDGPIPGPNAWYGQAPKRARVTPCPKTTRRRLPAARSRSAASCRRPAGRSCAPPAAGVRRLRTGRLPGRRADLRPLPDRGRRRARHGAGADLGLPRQRLGRRQVPRAIAGSAAGTRRLRPPL